MNAKILTTPSFNWDILAVERLAIEAFNSRLYGFEVISEASLFL